MRRGETVRGAWGFGMDQVIERKLRRLRRGGTPRVLDLFAGCGGLTLGFSSAGFESVGAVELDPHAAQTHGINFFPGSPHHAIPYSVQENPSSLFLKLCACIRKTPPETAVDVLLAGPPCQAFARVGRAKLRAEARRVLSPQAEHAYLVDERVSLYQRYLTYIEAFKPVALLMENVPDIMNHGGQNVVERVAEHLETLGYNVEYRLLNTSNFGVPQMRERMILQAIHGEANSTIRWPKPTHYSKLPPGYLGTRATALKNIHDPSQPQLFPETSRYAFIDCLDKIEQCAEILVPAVSARDAIGDLPILKTMDRHGNPVTEKGRRDLTIPIRLSGPPPSGYANLMRNWPGFEGHGSTNAHVIRHLPRDFKIFRAMGHGWEYPRIHAWVEAKRDAILRKRYETGLSVNETDPEVANIIKEWTIPYDPGKFPNKWWKMIADKPSRTLLAHLGKDSYSHIHYDCSQARTISVREAARLQSFPDGFCFCGSMNSAFRQIGNAVPPLFVYAIAFAMRETIGLPNITDIRVSIMGLPKWIPGSLSSNKESACAS